MDLELSHSTYSKVNFNHGLNSDRDRVYFQGKVDPFLQGVHGGAPQNVRAANDNNLVDVTVRCNMSQHFHGALYAIFPGSDWVLGSWLTKRALIGVGACRF